MPSTFLASKLRLIAGQVKAAREAKTDTEKLDQICNAVAELVRVLVEDAEDMQRKAQFPVR